MGRREIYMEEEENSNVVGGIRTEKGPFFWQWKSRENEVQFSMLKSPWLCIWLCRNTETGISELKCKQKCSQDDQERHQCSLILRDSTERAFKDQDYELKFCITTLKKETEKSVGALAEVVMRLLGFCRTQFKVQQYSANFVHSERMDAHVLPVWERAHKHQMWTLDLGGLLLSWVALGKVFSLSRLQLPHQSREETG